MRLTLALFKRKMPNGCIWRGKNRLAHHIYPVNIERMVRRLQVEENNMLLLRHPYLTLEQERGSTQNLPRRAVDFNTANFRSILCKKLEKKGIGEGGPGRGRSIPMEDAMNHLMHGEKWDCY